MIYKNLPTDLKYFVKTFIFGKCEYCHFTNYYWKLKRNIVFYEYITVYSDIWDGYYICNKNPIQFNKICEYCYKTFLDSLYYTETKKLII